LAEPSEKPAGWWSPWRKSKVRARVTNIVREGGTEIIALPSVIGSAFPYYVPSHERAAFRVNGAVL